jgi:hypothetical protein
MAYSTLFLHLAMRNAVNSLPEDRNFSDFSSNRLRPPIPNWDAYLLDHSLPIDAVSYHEVICMRLTERFAGQNPSFPFAGLPCSVEPAILSIIGMLQQKYRVVHRRTASQDHPFRKRI